MPFLPLYFHQLGVERVGEIAMWSGLSLGVTPALTAMLSPFWGRLADRYGRKIMVERSLGSFVVIMAATAFVTRAWHVFALRAIQGLFAGYGALTLTMAADSAPEGRMAQSIGLVQTAQRLGPALGPVFGGTLAALVGLRRAFLIAAVFYAAATALVFVLYDERLVHAHAPEKPADGAITFRNVLAFENFLVMSAVIFGFQFVDRSFGPVLPIYVGILGIPASHAALVSGILFSVAAGAGALSPPSPVSSNSTRPGMIGLPSSSNSSSPGSGRPSRRASMTLRPFARPSSSAPTGRNVRSTLPLMMSVTPSSI
jgi:MFS family permease